VTKVTRTSKASLRNMPPHLISLDLLPRNDVKCDFSIYDRSRSSCRKLTLKVLEENRTGQNRRKSHCPRTKVGAGQVSGKAPEGIGLKVRCAARVSNQTQRRLVLTEEGRESDCRRFDISILLRARSDMASSTIASISSIFAALRSVFARAASTGYFSSSEDICLVPPR
jgi:hypothetical protein